MTIYIIGSGLFGSIARDLLRNEGYDAITIDANLRYAASTAAGCLIKPSWLSCLGNKYKDGMGTLDKLYGLTKIPLQLFGAVKIDSIYHVSPSKILKGADIIGEVVGLNPDAGHIRLANGREYTGRVLVAAGVWSDALLGERFGKIKIQGQCGISYRFATLLPYAKLKVWAPYKQSVAFHIEEGVTWFGDGTSIVRDNWKQEYEDRALRHAAELDLRLSPDKVISKRLGIRPYVPGYTGWFRRAGDNCWVSTGGAKNGVVLAALQARQFLEELER